MSRQYPPDGPLTRRSLLAGVSAAASGLAGCAALSLGGRRDAVSVLAAGSLHLALDEGLRERVEVPLRVEARGSAALARLVAAGQRDPDVVTVADAALFDGPLRPDWYAEFATNSLVVAYDPDTEGGRRVADAGADSWYRPVLDREARLGRTDPDLDPLGYRTLLCLDLATDYYDADVSLRKRVPARSRVYPETQLVSQFETGGLDAAVTYRNMAVERGYEFVDLPPEIDLGAPRYADRYATATYELSDGKTVRGDVIRYASTVRRRSPAVERVFEAETTGDYLSDFGFEVPDDYPRYAGDVPDGLAD